MSEDRYLQAALALQKLGVSQAGSLQLLHQYPLETIERQLYFLPMRKARPNAFIVDAIRFDYSPPKAFYAKTKTQPSQDAQGVDKDAELPAGFPNADLEGHRAESGSADSESIERVEQGGTIGDPLLPNLDEEDWSPE